MIRYAFTPAAEGDLDDLWEFIAEDGLDSADRVVEDIYRAIERLADMPGIGHTRVALGDASLRVWRVHSYLIVTERDRSD